jgi:hypothetical protein
MKHVCVETGMGDGEAPGAGDSHAIVTLSDAAGAGSEI